MATAAHREVRRALFVVTGESNEAAVRCQHWVYLCYNNCLDLGRDVIVINETFDLWRLWFVGITDE